MIDRKIDALKKRRDHVDTMLAIARVKTIRKKLTAPAGDPSLQGLRVIRGGSIKAFVPMTERAERRNLFIVPVA